MAFHRWALAALALAAPFPHAPPTLAGAAKPPAKAKAIVPEDFFVGQPPEDQPERVTSDEVGVASCPGPTFQVNVLTDNYPQETYWTLLNLCTGDVEKSVSLGYYRYRTRQYRNTYCVPSAQYRFLMKDSEGDGLCCRYGNGNYEALFKGAVVAAGTSFEFDQVWDFGSCDPPPPPTPAPSVNAGSGCCNEGNLVVRFTDLAARWVEWSERGPTVSSHFWVHVSAAMFDAFNAFEPETTGAFANLEAIRPPFRNMVKAQKLAMIDSAFYVITTLGETLLKQENLEAEDGEDAAERLALLLADAARIRAEERESVDANSEDIAAAQTVSNAVTDAILKRVTEDGSNFQNDYADTSGYKVRNWCSPVPVVTNPLTDYNFLDGSYTFNTFDPIRASNVDNTGNTKVNPLVESGWVRLTETFQSLTEFGIFEGGRQTPLTPHWGQITPLSIPSGSEFRVPVFFPYKANGELNNEWIEEAREVAEIGRAMQDKQCPLCRVISEYWELGDEFVYPPGWGVVRARDIAFDRNFDIRKSVQIIFGLSLTVYDAGVAAWDMKYFYDTVRPITTVNEIFFGSTVGDWRSDKKAVVDDRDQWRPYQSDKSLTPPFPDVPSGHSAFSTSASVVLRGLLESNVDDFTTEPVKSRFDLEDGFDGESANGNEEWQLSYNTHSSAADASGYSRLYGGIHLMQGNIVGLDLGTRVGHSSLAYLRQLVGDTNLGSDPVEDLFNGLVFGTGKDERLVAPCIQGSPVEVYGYYGNDVLVFYSDSGNCGPVFLFGGWGADTFEVGARATIQDYEVEDTIFLVGTRTGAILTTSVNNLITTVFADGIAKVDVSGVWELSQLVIQTDSPPAIPGIDNGIVCADFNQVSLLARDPIFVEVDGTDPPFGGGSLPTVGDRVIANKFVLDGPYSGSDYSVNKLEILTDCTFVNATGAPSCTLEIELEYCDKTGESLLCYTNSKLFAMGTSSPFGIVGGTERFMGAFGQLTGEIILGEQFRFDNVGFKFCHYKKKIFG